MCICTILVAASAVLFSVALCQAGGADSFREVLEVSGSQLIDGQPEGGEEARGPGGPQAATSDGDLAAAGSGSGAGDLEQPLLQGEA